MADENKDPNAQNNNEADLDELKDDLYEDEDKEGDEESEEESKDSGKEGDEKKEEDKSKESEGAPEKYEAFDLPEGITMSEEQFAEVSELAKAKNWDQKEAQELVSFHTGKLQKSLANHAEVQQKAWQEKVDNWGKESLADKEISGDNHKENIALALKTLDRFSDPALDENGNKISKTDTDGKVIEGQFMSEVAVVLQETGLGNNPALIKWAYRVGKGISEEEKVLKGSPASQTAEGDAEGDISKDLYAEDGDKKK